MKLTATEHECSDLIHAALLALFGGNRLPEGGGFENAPMNYKPLETITPEWLVLADWYEENGKDPKKADAIRSGQAILSYRYQKWLGTCFSLGTEETTVFSMYQPGVFFQSSNM